MYIIFLRKIHVVRQQFGLRIGLRQLISGVVQGSVLGLRPQHLKDLIQCRESGSDFLTSLTGFTNLVLAGRCPVNVIPIFFGGRLISLE